MKSIPSEAAPSINQTKSPSAPTPQQILSPLSPHMVPIPSSFSAFSGASPNPSAVSKGMPGGIDSGFQPSVAPSPIPSPKKGEAEQDDDAVSSQISGDEDFFTTPPLKGKPLQKRAESVVSGVSAKTSKTSKTNKTSKSKGSKVSKVR